MKTEIARVAHEVNRAYCRAIGDNSQPSWDDAPDWQKDSAVAGIEAHLANPGMTPEQSRAAWLAHKVAEGWVHDNHKDVTKKRHPCILPWADLPLEQRVKDHLFAAVVRAMAGVPEVKPTMVGSAFDQQVARMRPMTLKERDALSPVDRAELPGNIAAAGVIEPVASEKLPGQPVSAPVLAPTPELLEEVSAPE